MRTLTLVIGLASALGFSAISRAAAPTGSGPYVGVDIGRSNVSSKVYEASADPIFGVALGYSFNPTLAAEVFARSLSLRILDGLIGDKSYYPKEHVGMAVVGTVRMSDQLGLSGRLGVGRTQMRSGSAAKPGYDTTDPSVGAELRYDFDNSSWSAKLGALRFTESQVTTTTVGLMVRF